MLQEEHKKQLLKAIEEERQNQAREYAATLLKAREQFEDEKRSLDKKHREQVHTCEERIGSLENEIEADKDRIYNLEVR